jgi:hypothetical protein
MKCVKIGSNYFSQNLKMENKNKNKNGVTLKHTWTQQFSEKRENHPDMVYTCAD